MPKNILEDIKPLSREKKTPRPVIVSEKPESPVARTPRAALPREVPFVPEEPRRHSRYALWYIAGACVVGFLFSLSFLFEHATVTITPKSVPIALDATDTFTAIKDTTDAEQVAYTVMTLAGEETMKLPSTKTETVSHPAKGTVVLYNIYSASPYKLVKNTRVQSSNGQVYRLDSAVTIPGYTKSASTIIPGSVEAAVTAAVAGEEGNIDLSDFTLPGLAGTAQASKIYARSKVAFSGGISGTVYSVDQSAADAAMGALTTKLKTSLASKAKVQVPDGYVYFDGATVFATSDAAAEPYSKDPDVTIAEKGTLTAYLIKESSLDAAIAAKFVSQYDGSEPVSIPHLDAFTLAPAGALTPASDASFTFSLIGSGNVVWVIDPAAVKNDLAGKKKSLFEGIVGSIPGVDRADLVIKPFWKQSFPESVDRITVTILPVEK